MFARIFTRLFYAVIFFALGVWAAPKLGPVATGIDKGVAWTTEAAVGAWTWVEQMFDATITDAPKPAVAQAPVKAPEAKPVAAASSPPAAPSAATKPAPTATTAPDKAAVSSADLVARARAAWGRGDTAGALRAYREALDAAADPILVNGELGNAYWSLGRKAEAAKSYHSAALALIAADRKAEAGRLVEAIREGDATLAGDLSSRLAK